MHAEPKQNTPRADGASERSNADGGVTEWPRTGAFEDQRSRGSDHEDRSGRRLGSERVQSEGFRAEGSRAEGSDPRISIPGDPIRGGRLEEAKARGAQPRGCELKGSIGAAARNTERLSRAAERRTSRPPNWLRRSAHELRAPERLRRVT